MGLVILFDGICVMCSASAAFVIRHDPAAQFRLAAMQGDQGQAICAALGIDPQLPDSIVLLDDGRVLTGSDAVLGIASRLTYPWRLLAGLRIVPRGIRDRLYGWIARNRYRLFGRRDSCWIPGGEDRRRIL